jgi:hypothetical protein
MMRPIKTTSRSKPPAAAGSSLIGRCPRRGGRAFYHDSGRRQYQPALAVARPPSTTARGIDRLLRARHPLAPAGTDARPAGS